MPATPPNGNTEKPYDGRPLNGVRLPAKPRDPAAAMPGMPPNMGMDVVTHIDTFAGRVGSYAQTYRNADEAIKHSVANAEAMRNDCGIMECIEARQRATSLLPWHLEPEDENDQRQKALCEALTDILDRIPRFVEYRMNLMHAIWYGRYAVSQRFRWNTIKGGHQALTIDKWRPIHGDKLVFRYDDGTHTVDEDQIGIRVGGTFNQGSRIGMGDWELQEVNPVLPTDSGLAYFLEAWQRPLVAVHKHMIEDGPFEMPIDAGAIHGRGIRSRIYWSWFQQAQCLGYLLEYLERSAFGIEIWYYPWGNPEAKAQTEAAAQKRLGAGRNIVLAPRPIGDDAPAYDVQIVEPGLAGAEQVRSIVEQYFGWRIKRYILGQVLTSEVEGTGLGSGVADLHKLTFDAIIDYDARNLEETITTECLKHIKDFNFPWARSVHIKFKIDTKNDQALEKLEMYRQAWEMGLLIKSKDLAAVIGTEMIPEQPPVLIGPIQMQQQQMAMQQQMAEQQMQAEAQAAAAGPAGKGGGQQADDDAGGGGRGPSDGGGGGPPQGSGAYQFARPPDEIQRFSTGPGASQPNPWAHAAVGKWPGDMSDAEFIDRDAWTKHRVGQYLDALGNQTASSRTTPSTAVIPPVGSWQLDSTRLGHGRMIDQLAVLNPHALEATEDLVETNAEGRGWDSDRYRQWIMQGHEPPPIHVVQTDEGTLRVTDGHRRLHAHRALNKPIKAWVSWAAHLGKNDPHGKPIGTNLTQELAAQHGPAVLMHPRPANTRGTSQDKYAANEDPWMSELADPITPPAEFHHTPEFKRWFGDWVNDPANSSKVRPDGGDPHKTHHFRTVWHGSTNLDAEKGFEAFDPDTIGTNGSMVGPGFYFAEKPQIAMAFGRKPRQFYLNIRNPFDYDEPMEQYDPRAVEIADLAADAIASQRLDPDKEMTRYQLGITPDAVRDYVSSGSHTGNTPIQPYRLLLSAIRKYNEYLKNHENEEQDEGHDDPRIIHPHHIMHDAGYDGITHLAADTYGSAFWSHHLIPPNGKHFGRVWIAFHPSQIKSVRNRGTFDPNDERFDYEDAESPEKYGILSSDETRDDPWRRLTGGSWEATFSSNRRVEDGVTKADPHVAYLLRTTRDEDEEEENDPLLSELEDSGIIPHEFRFGRLGPDGYSIYDLTGSGHGTEVMRRAASLLHNALHKHWAPKVVYFDSLGPSSRHSLYETMASRIRQVAKYTPYVIPKSSAASSSVGMYDARRFLLVHDAHVDEVARLAHKHNVTLTPLAVRQQQTEKFSRAWELTRDELADAINAHDRQTLDAARPLLADMFPEYTAEYDPWGIHRAINKGDELPRIPMVQFTAKHRKLVQDAVNRGEAVPDHVRRDAGLDQGDPPAESRLAPSRDRSKGAEHYAAQRSPAPHWATTLTPAEYSAINEYTAAYFRNINNSLRAAHKSGIEPSEALNHSIGLRNELWPTLAQHHRTHADAMRSIDSAIDKHHRLAEDMDVYRAGDEDAYNAISKLNIGDVFVSPSYTSTTKNEDAVFQMITDRSRKNRKRVHMTIRLPAGTKHADLSKPEAANTPAISENDEEEVILPRQAAFRVKNIFHGSVAIMPRGEPVDLGYDVHVELEHLPDYRAEGRTL